MTSVWETEAFCEAVKTTIRKRDPCRSTLGIVKEANARKAIHFRSNFLLGESDRGTFLDRALRLRPQDYMLARMSPWARRALQIGKGLSPFIHVLTNGASVIRFDIALSQISTIARSGGQTGGSHLTWLNSFGRDASGGKTT